MLQPEEQRFLETGDLTFIFDIFLYGIGDELDWVVAYGFEDDLKRLRWEGENVRVNDCCVSTDSHDLMARLIRECLERDGECPDVLYNGDQIIRVATGRFEGHCARESGKLTEFIINELDLMRGIPADSVSIDCRHDFGEWLSKNATGDWWLIGERSFIDCDNYITEELFFLEDESDITLAKINFGGDFDFH